MKLCNLLALMLLLVDVAACFAQQQSPGAGQDSSSENVNNASQWSLESVALKSGPKFEGLVLNESDHQLEFAEVVRRPGQPMYAIVRAVKQSDIAQLKRLESNQKVAAAAWFEKFRRQADFAAAQAESLELHRTRLNDVPAWYYTGRWFDLTSTSEEASTRRVIVRLEQLFLAFRQVLPPRVNPSAPPQIVIYSHRDEYRDNLRKWGLDRVNNPAFYATTQRTIVASCNLDQIERHSKQVEKEQKEQQARWRERNAELNTTLADIAAEMKQKGFSPEEITAEVRARRSQWETEQADEKRRVAEVDRRNKQQLEQATSAFFRRLAHEAFHAYAENFVFPPAEGKMPRWLNEGLAQIFEAAPLDVDHLRIDAPDPARRAALKQDLNSRRPLTIASVLKADEEAFIQAHDREEIDRLYLYSWGIAWQLVFEQPAVQAEQIEKYLATEKEDTNAVRRFEKLVGQSLPEWEKGWKEKWK